MNIRDEIPDLEMDTYDLSLPLKHKIILSVYFVVGIVFSIYFGVYY